MSAWQDLHNEGVRQVSAGDLAGARVTLEAAVASASAGDRSQCLLNLAHVVDLLGEREHAVELMSEALPTAEGPLRAMIIASRADLLPWLDRPTRRRPPPSRWPPRTRPSSCRASTAARRESPSRWATRRARR